MSIPREPRQLMVNMMYLVLTAMLALNVSAEIMNAFRSMDKSLKSSNQLISGSSSDLMAALEKQVDAYPIYAPFKDKAVQARKLVTDLDDYINQLRQELIDDHGNGGYKTAHGTVTDIPKHEKSKDVTTRILVGTDATPGKGYELERRIAEARQQLLAMVTSDSTRALMAESFPLKIDESWKAAGKKSWTEHQFRQMPLAACLPLLSKIQNDLRSSEENILQYLLKQAKGEPMVLDNFIPVVAPKKSYVIQGEPFEAEIFLGAYSSLANNININVDGQRLGVDMGKAFFRSLTNTPGVQRHKVSIDITNPVTKEVQSYSSNFEYEVGQRSVTVAAEKMNVVYIGVDNPISVSAAGVSSNDLTVRGEGLTVTKNAEGKYIAKATATNANAAVVVSGKDLPETRFVIRVKRIPDPRPRIDGLTGSTANSGLVKTFEKVRAVLDNFDFDAKCTVEAFEMIYVPKSGDAMVHQNKGGDFDSECKAFIARAKAGDRFYFNDVLAKCPGDERARNIGSMTVLVK